MFSNLEFTFYNINFFLPIWYRIEINYTLFIAKFDPNKGLETPKVGAILKKSVDWSDTNAILPGESIDKNPRGLPITSDTLLQICQRVANTLLPPVKNLPEGC
jgi:hypothetical protein